VRAEGLHDHHVDRLVGHRADALEPTEGGVRNQVRVAVEQPGQRGAVILRHLHAIRQVDPAGVDAGDPVSIHDHGRSAGQELGAVESVRHSDRLHTFTFPRHVDGITRMG
jgi:hypothetical protein